MKLPKTAYRLDCWDDDKSEWTPVAYSTTRSIINSERTNYHNHGYRECDLRIVILDNKTQEPRKVKK